MDRAGSVRPSDIAKMHRENDILAQAARHVAELFANLDTPRSTGGLPCLDFRDPRHAV